MITNIPNNKNNEAPKKVKKVFNNNNGTKVKKSVTSGATVLKETFISLLIAFFAYIKQPDELIELRMFKCRDGIARVGYCKNNENSIRSIVENMVEQELLQETVFYNINPIKDDFNYNSNAFERIIPHRKGLADDNISEIKYIVVDIDPVRPTDTQATDDEQGHAFKLAQEVIAFLSEQGFPTPLKFSSGNGINLYYRVDLENTPDNKELVRGLLMYLHDKFSNDLAEIDTSVSNQSRFFKVAGTISKKGNASAERPNRLSGVIENALDVPLEVISFDNLTKLQPKSESQKPNLMASVPKKIDAGFALSLIRSLYKVAVDQNDVVYLLDESAHKAYDLSRDSIKAFIRHTIFQSTDKTVSDSLIETVRDTLICLKLGNELTKIVTASRQYYDPENYSFYYKMENEKILQVNKDGCNYANSDIFLTQSTNDRDYASPNLETNPFELISLLQQVINTENTTIELLAVYIVTLMVTHIDKPILVLSGKEGSGKTTVAKFIKVISDPSVADVNIPCKSDADYALMLSVSSVCVFDNVTNISQSLSDILCASTTQGVYQARKLYTDDEVVTLRLNGSVILTGITDVTENPDLKDRSLYISLNRISKSKRDGITEVKAKMDELLPQIMGAIFNTISQSITVYESLPDDLRSPIRMADFAKWGYAIAEVLGIGGETFFELLSSNQKIAIEETVENTPLITVIASLLAHKNSISGTATEVFEAINREARRKNILPTALPSDSATFSKELKTLEVTLEEIGIDVTRRKSNGNRIITLERIISDDDNEGNSDE